MSFYVGEYVNFSVHSYEELMQEFFPAYTLTDLEKRLPW